MNRKALLYLAAAAILPTTLKVFDSDSLAYTRAIEHARLLLNEVLKQEAAFE